MNTPATTQPIVTWEPAYTASVQDWVDWFFTAFLPAWIEHAKDPDGFGFYDALDSNAHPLQQDRRTVLAQARLVFTFSHIAELSHSETYNRAACVALKSLSAFRKSAGSYCRARNAERKATDDADDNLATSYDQCFVILGLCTFATVNPDSSVESELEACWQFIETHLTDNATGLLLEHDAVSDPADPASPWRAQNPHMHLYEAALQAYEMTRNRVWLGRAKQMRRKGLEFFYDSLTGTLIEFIAADLTPLSGNDGQRREIGHQCEWAWLLYREAELGGDSSVIDIADKLLAFAHDAGFSTEGVMQGAAFDAVSSDKAWRENTFLLWPQTEAIKTFAIRKDQPGYADKAEQLLLLIFKRYFSGHAAFVNQLDECAKPVWSDALSRLHYHLVLALSEGARAGLWRIPMLSDTDIGADIS